LWEGEEGGQEEERDLMEGVMVFWSRVDLFARAGRIVAVIMFFDGAVVQSPTVQYINI